MDVGQGLQKVGDYIRYSRVNSLIFQEKFPHSFLVLVEIGIVDPDEDTDDFFTGTKMNTDIKALMAIAEGHKLDPTALVFPVAKRPGANPYSGLVTIGRASNCDVVLNINGVSKFHVFLVESSMERGNYLAGDGNSKNGTLVNGKKIGQKKRCPLKNGDRISLSSVAVLRYFTAHGFWEILTA